MDLTHLNIFDGGHANGHGALYLQVLILLGASTFLILAMQRLRLSPILGYMFAGILIGPSLLGFITDVENLRPVAELGIACMLFVIGLELSWARLKSMRQLVFGLGGLQVILTGLAISVIIWWTGQRYFTAALIGVAFALSSTAVVLQLLHERGAMTTRSGRAAFAVLLFQDLAAIPLLAVATAGTVPESGWQVLFSLAKALVALAIILGVAHFVSKPVLRRIAQTRNNELFTAFTLFVVIGMGVATESAGLSLSLGAFLAGLLLSGTAYRHKVEVDIAPFKGLLLGLFFMTVGMNLDLALIGQHLGAVIGGVVLLLIVKGVLIYGIARMMGKSHSSALHLTLWLAGAGEFALVVFQAMQANRFLPFETAQILLSIAVISLILTPLLNAVDRWWQQRKIGVVSRDSLRQYTSTPSEQPQIVIAGYGRVGEMVARELRQSGIDYMALDMNAERVAKAQALGQPVYFGSSQDINLLHQMELGNKNALIIALDNARDVTNVVQIVREQWPRLPILARAYDQDHASQLQSKGANVTVTETMAASLALAEAAIVLAEDAH